MTWKSDVRRWARGQGATHAAIGCGDEKRLTISACLGRVDARLVEKSDRMARGLVQNGTVPRSRVTPAFVQADVFREYGIELNAAQAEFVVNEITR